MVGTFPQLLELVDSLHLATQMLGPVPQNLGAIGIAHYSVGAYLTTKSL